MPTELNPIVGNWYKPMGKAPEFEVIALDEEEGLVEIQDFEGAMEELDLEHWYTLDLESIEPPEDWTGPMDNIELDDLGYTETGMEPRDWSAAPQEMEQWGDAPEEALHEYVEEHLESPSSIYSGADNYF